MSGGFALTGELGYATVERILRDASGLFAEGTPVVIDLAEVARADSAGIALLLEWRRRAREAGVSLKFAHPPTQVRAIAGVAGVDGVLFEEPKPRSEAVRIDNQ